MSAPAPGKPTAHRPVLLEEAVAALAIRGDGAYVDATFGRGGHSHAILQRLGPAGRLIALDRDPAAVAAGIDRVFALPGAGLAQMGEEGHGRVVGITWDHVIDTLTEGLR